jgi:hypothetical protein
MMQVGILDEGFGRVRCLWRRAAELEVMYAAAGGLHGGLDVKGDAG